MKNIIISLLILAALGFGVKSYMEYRYSNLLNQQALLLSSSAAISHEGVAIDWDGSLLINSLRIQPIEAELTLYVGQLRVSSPFSFKTIIDLRSLENGTFDQFFNINVNRVSVEGKLLGTADAKSDCRDLPSTFVFSAIDMVPLRANATFKIDARGTDTVVIRYDGLDQLASYRGRLVVDKNNLIQVMRSASALNINKLSVSAKFSKDKADQLMAYCADLFAVSKEEYLDKVVASSKFSKDSFGIDLGSQARFGLAAFLNGESEITARFGSFGDLNNLVTELSEDSIWHTLEVDIDDAPISLDIPDVETAKIEVTIAEVENLSKRLSKKQSYIVRDIEDATNFIGEMVRIDRTNGRSPVQGRLLGESLDGLLVKVSHPGGDVTLTIEIADTESFRVLQEN